MTHHQHNLCNSSNHLNAIRQSKRCIHVPPVHFFIKLRFTQTWASFRQIFLFGITVAILISSHWSSTHFDSTFNSRNVEIQRKTFAYALKSNKKEKKLSQQNRDLFRGSVQVEMESSFSLFFLCYNKFVIQWDVKASEASNYLEMDV